MPRKLTVPVPSLLLAILLLAHPLLAQTPAKIKGATPDSGLAGLWLLDSVKSDVVSDKIDSTFKHIILVTTTSASFTYKKGDPLPRIPAGPPPIALLNAEQASRKVLLTEVRAERLIIALYPEGVSAGVSDSQSISWVTDKKEHPIPVGAQHRLLATSYWKDGVLENKLVTPTGNEMKRTLKRVADGNTLEVVTQVTVDGHKFKYTRRFVRGSTGTGRGDG